MIELHQAFRHITFVEHNHTYIDKSTGALLPSVTTILKKLKGEYNSSYWSYVKALQRNGYDIKFDHKKRKNGFSIKFPGYNTYDKFDTDSCDNHSFNWDTITPDEMKQEWDMLAKRGTSLGTYLHNTLENLFLRKEIEQDLPRFFNSFHTHEAIRYIKDREQLDIMANEFYNMISETHVPIALEYVVGDSNKNIAGMFDALLYNIEKDVYEIWDYKTDKEIQFNNYYGDKIAFFDLEDCNFNKYSLQLGMYKEIIESNTGIKIDGCYIAHFNYKASTTDIHPITDYTTKIKEFFNGKNKSVDF